MTHSRWTVLSILRAVFLIAALSALTPASATERPSLILNETETYRLFTDVVINGVETSALLDTGATIPLIGES